MKAETHEPSTDGTPTLEEFQETVLQEQLTPLWMGALGQLREPRTQIQPYLWRWKEVRQRVLQSLKLIPLGVEGAERRVLTLRNPGVPPSQNRNNAHVGCSDPDHRRDRGCSFAPSHHGRIALHHRRRGRLHRRKWRARVDGAEGSAADAKLVLARPFQRTFRADDLVGWPRRAAGSGVGGYFSRELSKPGSTPTDHRAAG